MSSSIRLTLSSIMLFSLAGSLPAPEAQSRQSERDLRREEAEDYFRKWLREDVVYIITPEEKSVFEALTTIEERERFIEQFWLRRDPNPTTSINEYKEEHYRRIAYANEHLAAGWPGWMTDRGKVYIIHGPPDEIEEHPSGGTYERPLHEGGGTTAVYPFEIWRYRQIPGLGADIELQFVDRAFSGEYRLALSPEEKDAFMMVPTAGHTLAEHMGLAQRRDRPFLSPTLHGSYPLAYYREKDSVFNRYATFVNVQKPTELKYPDLRENVEVQVTFNQIPFQATEAYFRLRDRQVLVPITVEVAHRELSFVQHGGLLQARLAVYGVVTSMTNRVAAEFEDEIYASYRPAEAETALKLSSRYQRILVLEGGLRYKADIVLKDLNSGRVGVARRSLIPGSLEQEPRLTASSLVLSDFIRPVEDPLATEEEMFVLGNVKVRPSLSKTFSPADYFAVYLQLYNVAIDQSTLNPSFQARYRILKGEQVLLESLDEVGESVQFFSEQRLVLIKRLPLDGLEPETYTVQVEFLDRIQDQVVTVSEPFRVLDLRQVARTLP